MLAIVVGLGMSSPSQNGLFLRGGWGERKGLETIPYVESEICSVLQHKERPTRIRIVPQASDGVLQDLQESKDGTRLVTHDRDFAPRLWDAKRQILLTVLDGHPDPVDRVAFTADGKRIVTRSPRQVEIWDSLRARRIATFPAPSGDAVTAAETSPDGSTLLIGTQKGLLFQTPLAQAPLKKLGSLTKGVTCLTVSPDQRLFAASADGIARTWNLKTGLPTWTVPAGIAPIRWAEFSPNGNLLTTEFAETLQDKPTAARLWNSSGKLLQTFTHTVGSRGVDHTQSGAAFVGKLRDQVAVFEADGAIGIYSLAGKPVRRLTGHRGHIREIRVSNDRRYLSTVATDDRLFMWDVEAGKSIPFDPGEGVFTAGDFSPNRPVFWLGYSGGDVRQFDLRTGKATKATYGAVAPLRTVSPSPDAGLLWAKTAYQPSIGSYSFSIDPTGGHGDRTIGIDYHDERRSPDGRYVAIRNPYAKPKAAILDLWTSTYVRQYDEPYLLEWSPDGAAFSITDSAKGMCWVQKMADKETAKTWQFELPKNVTLAASTWSPDGKSLIHVNWNGEVEKWDWETGKDLLRFDSQFAGAERLTISADGKKAIVWQTRAAAGLDLESGKTLWRMGFAVGNWLTDVGFSSDSRQLLLGAQGICRVLQTDTGKVIFERANTGSAALTQDGKRVLVADGNTATVWDIETKKPLQTLSHPGRVTNVGFAQNESRLLTVDSVGGMNVWSAKGDKLATMVLMKDNSWLVYDPAGRYDAKNPSDVQGAYFVLEWSGGLEPISMPQLKGQFYEPHLLAKALGTDPEPLREVPDLEGLRLFPELKVKTDSPNAFSIAATERDDGGIGTVRISINGKEVLRKKGAGFFKFDAAHYQAYLLPEARLSDGAKNLMSVTVTNESGDLMSPPEVVPLTTPKGLKVPDVHLYALCVGIGDYAGTGGDLAAPPSDAKALAAALRETGERLLPGHVTVDTLTTEDGPRPTRPNILAWLKSTAAKATSSDIVFLFVAGHGMSNIGDRSGYFLLTSEADPTNVGPAAAATVTIGGDELRQALAAIPAGKQVVVLDTCHSGAATASLLTASRSVSGEYERAWESIKDTTGTWLLAGAAADQLSYESSNVDHGMLTYALLEAIDHASPEALRKAPSGELFVDVERWLEYAANRVESLKSEVGIAGVQKPDFKRSTRGGSFDVGVMDEKRKGFLELRAPAPIVIVGNFQRDEEDPLNLEEVVATAMRDSKTVKPWFDVAKHPGVYRMAGSYTLEGDTVKAHITLQIFDDRQQRKNLESFDLSAPKTSLFNLATQIRTGIESRIKAIEATKTR